MFFKSFSCTSRITLKIYPALPLEAEVFFKLMKVTARIQVYIFIWPIKTLFLLIYFCDILHPPICFPNQLKTHGYIRKMAEKAMEESYHHQLEDPWIRESVFTKKLLVDEGPNGKSRFHLIDPWHMLHLGMGKAWVASGVMLLQNLIPESSIDKRVSIIAAEYKRYCKRMKIDPIIRKIDLSNFGGGGSNEANGSWNKAAITSNFLRFLEDYCEKNIDTSTASEKLRIFASPHIRFDCFSCMGFSFKVLNWIVLHLSFSWLMFLRAVILYS